VAGRNQCISRSYIATSCVLSQPDILFIKLIFQIIKQIRQSGGLNQAGRHAGGDETGTHFIIGFSIAVPLAILIALSCWYFQRRKRGLQFLPRRWSKERNKTRKTGKKSMAQVKMERAEAEARVNTLAEQEEKSGRGNTGRSKLEGKLLPEREPQLKRQDTDAPQSDDGPRHNQLHIKSISYQR
jgi:hypothetical protein